MARSIPKKRKIGGLECLEVAGRPEAPTIVLFHGFGADMADLASLADVIQAPRDSNWYFPNGPISVPIGPHIEGRAWFPISISEFEKSAANGQPIDLSLIVPPGMKKARERAMAFIDALGVPANRLVLGGFSQGAMLATDLVLHRSETPAGLVLLSGTLVNADEWKTRAPQKSGLAFFQSHGARDSVLGFAMAQKLETLLRESGWRGRLQRFEGGHEIPSEVLIQLGGFLRQVLPR